MDIARQRFSFGGLLRFLGNLTPEIVRERERESPIVEKENLPHRKEKRQEMLSQGLSIA